MTSRGWGFSSKDLELSDWGFWVRAAWSPTAKLEPANLLDFSINGMAYLLNYDIRSPTDHRSMMALSVEAGRFQELLRAPITDVNLRIFGALRTRSDLAYPDAPKPL